MAHPGFADFVGPNEVRALLSGSSCGTCLSSEASLHIPDCILHCAEGPTNLCSSCNQFPEPTLSLRSGHLLSHEEKRPLELGDVKLQEPMTSGDLARLENFTLETRSC